MAVRELQQALATEEFERTSSGPRWFEDENGTLNIFITRSANSVPPVSASTNASALGITQEASDAAIAAGKTSAWDAAGYAAKVTGYEVWNFLTAGFVQRHDARLTAEANGQLSSNNLWRATALDAMGSVGSLYLGGRAGSLALNRLGTGYAGYMGSGAAGGAVFDLTQQGTQLGINTITGGQAGQKQFSLDELAIATSSGAVLGGALRLASTSPLMNRPLQSPVYLDLQGASTAYSGIPIGMRSPFATGAGGSPGTGTTGGPLILFDGEYATRQLLGTTTTPGGRQINFHAADRMVNSPAGRAHMSPGEVDQVLDGATRIVKRSFHPQGNTLTIENANMPGRPRVIVDEATGSRVITVINPRQQ